MELDVVDPDNSQKRSQVQDIEAEAPAGLDVLTILERTYSEFKLSIFGAENAPEFARFAHCRSRERMVDQMLSVRQEQDGYHRLKSSRITLVQDWEDKAIEQATRALVHRYTPASIKSGPTLETGHPFRGMDFLEIAKTILTLSNKNTRSMGPADVYNVIRRTNRFKSIPLNLARQLLVYSMNAATPLPSWITKRPIKNFGLNERRNQAYLPELKLVVEGVVPEGEFTTYEAEFFRLVAYSVWVCLDRSTLLSDDLNQFSSDILAMGYQSRQLEWQLILAQIVNNPLMADGFHLFSAEHKNIGKGNPLDGEGLSLARMMMRQQKIGNGRPASRLMKSVLLGPALETQAEKWAMASYANTVDDYNPFGGNLELSVVPEFDDEWDLWFAMANGGQGNPVMELGYLEGQEYPYVMLDEDIRYDGLLIRYGIDRGAKALDWRGMWCNRLPEKKLYDPSMSKDMESE